MERLGQQLGLADIEKRVAKMKEIAAEREATEILQLPLWHEDKCGSPNSFLRSALFAAIQSKDRTFIKDTTLFSQQGVTIKFTGERLNQEDMTVWLTLVHLARQNPLGNECSFTAYEILKHMGVSIGGDQRKRLHHNVERLAACLVTISANRTTYGGSLVDDFYIDETTDHYKLTLNRKLIYLFGQNDWTAINWEQRKQLRQKPLALKLHEYYSSHQTPIPVTVEFFYNITGSQNSQLRDFKRQLKAALEALVKIGFLINYSIESNLVSVCRKNTQALLPVKTKT